MVSYADLMTLLFALFVVLYAASNINSEKFYEMRRALEVRFSETSNVPVSEAVRQFLEAPSVEGLNQALDPEKESSTLPQRLLQISDISAALPENEYTLSTMDQWISIEVPMGKLFRWDNRQNRYGSRITQEGAKTMVELVNVFAEGDEAINIEVFSADTLDDDNPWQHGAMQGAAIVQYLQLEGLQPSRLAVSNYGPYQPIATNDDEQGRQLNARVNFMIDRTGWARERLKTVTKRHLQPDT
ncbi:chemotaxis protein MotB [Oceanobacter sp. RED65]|uniref:Chemotaxis protein MotB n=2 Tax=Bermanella marisrubri TaxID=207949 RepID=Q1N2T9_9GAMM|nr:chemotaxis protein MotB [Oceanobacter sp. RED65] [Bermanella marisrubri]